MTRIFILAIAAALISLTATAKPCPGNPQALGTEREISVDARTTPRVGRKQFPETLSLHAKELVLTFDDGPWPSTTPKVLDALKRECVQATFFLLGRNAAAHPPIARRVFAEGHSIGHHGYSHRLLGHMPLAKAEAEIDRGIAADELAVHGERRPTTPFFRFPGFASNRALLDRMSERGLVVFGADVWASDWVPMRPDQELHLILSRIEQAGRGIVLFHDTKAQTTICFRRSFASSNDGAIGSCTSSRPMAATRLNDGRDFYGTRRKSLENSAVTYSQRVIFH